MCFGGNNFSRGFSRRREQQLVPIARPEVEPPEVELGSVSEEDIERVRRGRKRFQIPSATTKGQTAGLKVV